MDQLHLTEMHLMEIFYIIPKFYKSEIWIRWRGYVAKKKIKKPKEIYYANRRWDITSL